MILAGSSPVSNLRQRKGMLVFTNLEQFRIALSPTLTDRFFGEMMNSANVPVNMCDC